MTQIRTALANFTNVSPKSIKTITKSNAITIIKTNIFENYERLTVDTVREVCRLMGRPAPAHVFIEEDYTDMYVPKEFKELYKTIETAPNDSEIRTTIGTIWKDRSRFCLCGKFYPINDNTPAILVKLNARSA